MQQQPWSEQLANRFGKSLRNRREELGLKVQEVSDRTNLLGHPISRTTITDYELGRRKDRIMLGDAVTLSHALSMDLLPILIDAGAPDGGTLHIEDEANALIEKGIDTAIERITNVMKGA